MLMKRNLFRAVTIIALLSWIPFSYAEVVDKIVVIINDEIITQGDLDRILYPIYVQYRNLYSPEEVEGRMEAARHTVLRQLIQDKLLLSEAKRKKIEVTDDEVEERMDELKRRFQTEEEFKKAMSEENLILVQLEKQFRERIMIDKLIDMEIRRTVSISPSEIISYYESHKSQFKEPRKVKLRSILIRTNEERSEEEAIRAAKQILKRLKKGGNFGLLAKEYSEGPYAASGGDMGWVKEGELMGRINDLVFTLDENEISGILKTNLGFHVFKVEEKVDAREMEFPAAKAHVERFLFNKKIEEKLGQWIEQLKNDAYIAFR